MPQKDFEDALDRADAVVFGTWHPTVAAPDHIGHGMESFEGWPVEDLLHAAVVGNDDDARLQA